MDRKIKNGICILIDFDGTCVTHDYPRVGKDIGSVPVLKKLVENGHALILFTMRSDLPEPDMKFLTDAVNWFKENNIPLYGIQTNPTQHIWTSSPKAYGQLIIDDICLGIPLKTDWKLSDRPFVDWVEVEKLLKEKKLI